MRYRLNQAHPSEFRAEHMGRAEQVHCRLADAPGRSRCRTRLRAAKRAASSSATAARSGSTIGKSPGSCRPPKAEGEPYRGLDQKLRLISLHTAV